MFSHAVGMVEQRPKVLIIDDDSGSQQMVAETFEQAGYVVITAEDGDRGLQLAIERHPDAIVTDLYLPLRTGAELIHLLRTAGSKVPVVMMSGAVEGKVTAFRCHADAFLEKPFDVFEAVRVVDGLLQRVH